MSAFQDALKAAQDAAWPFETAIHGYQDIGRAAARIAHPAKATEAFGTKLAEAVQRAGEKTRVNPVILWGIFGKETAYGRDLKTSSAGAEGPFQFLPSTAKQYGYPLTANLQGEITNLPVFQQQAEGAGRYLKSLLKGNPNPSNEELENAITAYKGGKGGPGTGTYDLAEVIEAGKTMTAQIGLKYQHERTIMKANEEPKSEGSGILGEIFGGVVLPGVLLLAGAVLVVYGIMVAVRPRERALSLPSIPMVA